MNKTESAPSWKAQAQAMAPEIFPNQQPPDLSLEVMQRTIHELRTHQIELELQNHELRRMQAELDSSQARYFDFYDMAPAGYVTVDQDNRILQANLATAGLLGVTRDALLKQPISRFIAEDDQDIFYLLRQQIATSGTAQSCELRLRRSAGLPVWTKIQALAVHSDPGQPLLRMVLSDISERKAMELRLQRDEAQLRTILDGGSDAIFITDPAGRYRYVNHQATQLLGFSRDELLAMSIADLTPAGKLPEVLSGFQQLLSAGAMRCELSLKRRDGSTVAVELNGALLADGRVYGACRDITERKQAEAALLAHERLRDAILDAVPSQIAVLDRFGVIMAVNQTWRRFAQDNGAGPAGLEPNSHIGLNYLSICQAADGVDPLCQGSQVSEGILAVINGAKPSFHFEYPCPTPAGPRWFSLSVTPLYLQDHSVVVTHTDITERRQFQAAQLAHAVELGLADSRQRLREMVALNQATLEEERKHIAREVHDELGQVLTALRMDLSLLDMRYGALDPGLLSEVKGMKTLVDQAILGVRNVATHLRPMALDMGLVPAIDWLCQEFVRLNGLPCGLDAPDNLDIDTSRAVVVFRIVQESLTNITRYAQASQVKVQLRHCGQDLLLTVSDDGQGFDLGQIELKKTFGLLGMRERAIALGGRLSIASSPGKGSSVSLSIPFCASATGVQP
jgi:PAS domain S-box-containing protein